MNSYLIILLPPTRIAKTVDRYRKKYAKYSSYSIPPHITIYPPFFLKDISEKRLLAKLESRLLKTKQCEITFNSIDYFEGKNNVAFIKPDTKSGKYITYLLVRIVKLLEGYTKNVYEEYNLTQNKFNPHMTIAERIPKNHLPKVKKGLLNFNRVFTFKVESIFVFKQSTNFKSWKTLREIPFK